MLIYNYVNITSCFITTLDLLPQTLQRYINMRQHVPTMYVRSSDFGSFLFMATQFLFSKLNLASEDDRIVMKIHG